MSSSRVAWIDAARALAVVLVVLYHLLIWTRADLAPAGADLERTWAAWRGTMSMLRIPLLMVLSGYLAARALSRGWASVRLRFIANYWIYVVWVTIFFAFYLVIYAVVWKPGLPQAITSFPAYAWNLISPNTILWYVLAVAIFPVVLWVLRRLGVPAPLIIGFAFALWAVGNYGDVPDSLGKLLRTFVFFAIGALLPEMIERFARLNWATALTLCATWVLVFPHVPTVFPGPIGALLVSILGVAAILAAFPHLFRGGIHTRVAAFVGKRTLDIYVLHLPILSCLYLLMRKVDGFPDVLASAWTDAVFVAAAVALTVALSLGIGALLRRVPGIMGLPAPWLRRLQHERHSPATGADAQTAAPGDTIRR